jgi:hypothetical protein
VTAELELTGISDRRRLISRTRTSTPTQGTFAPCWRGGSDRRGAGWHDYARRVVTKVVARSQPGSATQCTWTPSSLTPGERVIDPLLESDAGHYRDSIAGPGFGWLISRCSLEALGVTTRPSRIG